MLEEPEYLRENGEASAFALAWLLANGVIYFKPEDFDAVEKALADNNIEVMMSEIAMLPDTMAELSDEDVVKVRKMLEALEDLDDVQDVYTNADLPEEDEE